MRSRAPQHPEGQGAHPDTCSCDGCVNSNYRRPRGVILAELESLLTRDDPDNAWARERLAELKAKEAET